MAKTKLILASASPSRKTLLDFLGIEHECIPADIDESEIMNTYSEPKDVVTKLALKKAETVKEKLGSLEGRLIVACDTVNTRGGSGILGKPENRKQAKDMLMKLLKHSDFAHTGICILDPDEKKPIIGYEKAEFQFDIVNLKESDIDSYISSGEPLYFSGAWNPNGKFAKTFTGYTKGFPQAVFSFPFDYLIPSLRNHGLLPDLGIKKIALCSSSKFFDKLPEIKKELSQQGYFVYLPSMKDFHHNKEDALSKIQNNLIKEHFWKIDQSDAVYVANFTKNKIKGYIGGNVLLEMGKAFDRDIPIFLKYDFSKELSYKEEILAMQPIVIGRDWPNMNKIIKNNK